MCVSSCRRRPERLEFLYDPGLAAVATENANRHGVRFQNQDQRRNNKNQKQSIPGSLFDDKAHFANDSWRKSHSDPLLLIRQQEFEARKSVSSFPSSSLNCVSWLVSQWAIAVIGLFRFCCNNWHVGTCFILSQVKEKRKDKDGEETMEYKRKQLRKV